ncbi:MAG: hypothetical protein LBD06_09285, partial [Candidatus Accumulibacter sp.]|jgi:hypothetical protein|nr:hypothetical protein [Accumulibacter sp.]
MVTSTVLVIFFAPLFYVMIYKLMSRRGGARKGVDFAEELRSGHDRRRDSEDRKGVDFVEGRRSGHDRRRNDGEVEDLDPVEGEPHE